MPHPKPISGELRSKHRQCVGVRQTDGPADQQIGRKLATSGGRIAGRRVDEGMKNHLTIAEMTLKRIFL